ncbi:MAG: glycosyltransferase [Candidatus Sericytochromatia bacterium]|nr:glycosyltransferase [Candidatus Sericytochromatia bacterium]
MSRQAEAEQPVVLHAMRDFLPLTENWVYEQMRSTPGFKAVVACDRRLHDEWFPWPVVHELPREPLGRGLVWLNRLHRHWRFANWPGAYRGLLKQHSPALIHAHFGDRGVLMLGAALRFGLPLVTTFYGYDVSKLPRERKWLPRLRWLFARGDRFLVEGPHMRRALLALGAPPERTFVHHLGIDLTGIPFAVRTPGAGPMRVLMAASFREKKGLAYGLRAFCRLASRRPGELSLSVIGDGPLRPELEGIVAQEGAAHQVTWLGYQPHSAFQAALASAHLFVSPSVVARDGDSEGGAPVSLLEAQASGVPILATWHADVPEATVPGRSAVLVMERDVAALEQQLEWFLDHPGAWAGMGLVGRQHVVRHFDAARQGERLAVHYREVIQGQGPTDGRVHSKGRWPFERS